MTVAQLPVFHAAPRCRLVDNLPMLLHSEIEVLNPNLPRGRFRSVLFDFDGTLSLIREGWPQVMIPMMVAALRETGTGETEAELHGADWIVLPGSKQVSGDLAWLRSTIQSAPCRPAASRTHASCTPGCRRSGWSSPPRAAITSPSPASAS